MDHVEDVERLFSWLKAPMVHYREFAPQREVAEAVATWPIAHRAAVQTGIATEDEPAPQGSTAARERIARDSRSLPTPGPVQHTMAETAASAEPIEMTAGRRSDVGTAATLAEPVDEAGEPTTLGFEEPREP